MNFIKEFTIRMNHLENPFFKRGKLFSDKYSYPLIMYVYHVVTPHRGSHPSGVQRSGLGLPAPACTGGQASRQPFLLREWPFLSKIFNYPKICSWLPEFHLISYLRFPSLFFRLKYLRMIWRMINGKGLRTFLSPQCPFFCEAFTFVCELPWIIVQFPLLVCILSLLSLLPILYWAHTRNQKIIGKRKDFFHENSVLPCSQASFKWQVACNNP